MALGKRNNGNFRLSSVEVGAPRIWIHLNRIRKKQMEEKIGTGHSLHDVVSLQLFSSHLNQSKPHSNHVNRRKTRTSAPNCPSSSTTKRTCLLLCRIKWLLVPRLGKAERLSPSPRRKHEEENTEANNWNAKDWKTKKHKRSPKPDVDVGSVVGYYLIFGFCKRTDPLK